MPTIQEVTAELTGPGGAFEVIETTIGGRDVKAYKDRLPNLRSVAEIAITRGTEVEFIVHGQRRISYEDFLSSANGVAGALADLGVSKGDRVAVLSANNPEWCLTFWASVGMGAILVGLNGWWKTDEIIYGLSDSGAKILVADEKALRAHR